MFTCVNERCGSMFTPDFLLTKSQTYVEVKGWWRGDALAKFEAFKEQYPELRVKIVDRDKMKELGIPCR